MAAPALKQRLRDAGILRPGIVIAEAERTGLALELACALLEKESSGGRNVYGHDPSIFRGAGRVTRSNYAEYKRRRLASRNRSMQGVGPCQLTWWELQDAADAQGGCWRPAVNMRVGFGHLATLVKRYGESDGARRYNGSGAAAEAYSRDLLAKARRWETIIDGAEARVPKTDRKPARKPARRKAEREPARRAAANGAGHNGSGEAPPRRRAPARETPPAPPGLSALATEFREREAAADRAWRKLVAHGHRRRRRLQQERAEVEAGRRGLPGEEASELLAALARIEGKLGTLVEISWRRPEAPAPAEGPAVPPEAPAPATAPAVTPPASDASAAPAAPATASASAAPAGPAAATVTAPAAPAGAAAATVTASAAPGSPAAAPATPARARALSEYRVAELVREVEALEARARELRGELIGRYEAVDAQLVRLLGPEARPRERRRQPGPAGAPGRTRRREGDPRGGKAADTVLGDRGLFVRRSKIALSRYLAKKGSAEHAALRRTLRREAATPRTGDLASPAWGKAVEAAQHVAGRPVTGELDGELVRILQPHWPRDHVVKRMIRTTPAWRAIPGQLTPNFNVKELACKDPARTAYVQGLMREQGLSKKQARARAKALATRLERLRRLGGDRPLVVTSAFRTKAYNASLTGSATNSAHTRGFAVDVPPPRAVSLLQHKQHAAKAFECGIGYYPPGAGGFVHCDFDPTLGRRFW